MLAQGHNGWVDGTISSSKAVIQRAVSLLKEELLEVREKQKNMQNADSQRQESLIGLFLEIDKK